MKGFQLGSTPRMQDHVRAPPMASKKKRFVRINEELVLIRETHRSVLEWMRFAGQEVSVLSLQLSSEDLGECARALIKTNCDWQNDSGTFRVRRSAEEMELTLRSTGINAQRQVLQLDQSGLSKLRAAISEFTGKDAEPE